MEQLGIPTFILITAIGVGVLAGCILFLALASGYLRNPVHGVDPAGLMTQPAPNEFVTRAPAGSMAERQQNIEELLQRKERESLDI